jgi:hypothetical protein
MAILVRRRSAGGKIQSGKVIWTKTTTNNRVKGGQVLTKHNPAA